MCQYSVMSSVLAFRCAAKSNRPLDNSDAGPPQRRNIATSVDRVYSTGSMRVGSVGQVLHLAIAQ